MRPLLIARQSLALDIWPIRPANLRPFAPEEAEPAQPVGNRVQRILIQSPLVGILDAQDKCTAGLACGKPVEECGACAADMQITRRAGAKRTRIGVRGSVSAIVRSLLHHRLHDSIAEALPPRNLCTFLTTMPGAAILRRTIDRRRAGRSRRRTALSERGMVEAPRHGSVEVVRLSAAAVPPHGCARYRATARGAYAPEARWYHGFPRPVLSMRRGVLLC